MKEKLAFYYKERCLRDIKNRKIMCKEDWMSTKLYDWDETEKKE